ncbi:hypothetical protein PENSPDRAFT_737946 [Peniophora sp. CONT]|nr:hypothetical protein PENSPDRAFT_737946 [Peniophora sp. CONT]
MSESALVEFLKPRHAEAVTQMRNSLAALLLLVVLTSLLPLPALPAAIYKYLSSRYNSPYERAAIWTELSATCLLLLSSAQAAWGVISPRKPALKPAATPSKSLLPPSAASTPDWRRTPHALSPNTTPQRQRSFATPTTSDPRGLASSYSLNFVPPSPGDSSIDTSVSFTPSPSPLSAYRGRRSLASSTRALDESVLARLVNEASDDDEEY